MKPAWGPLLPFFSNNQMKVPTMNSATENKAYLIAFVGIVIVSSLITSISVLITGVAV